MKNGLCRIRQVGPESDSTRPLLTPRWGNGRQFWKPKTKAIVELSNYRALPFHLQLPVYSQTGVWHYPVFMHCILLVKWRFLLR